MSIRPTTWAMLWYPLVCVALAAIIGAWLWAQCGDARQVAGCRSDVVPGMLLFFLAILVIGMVVLAIVWFIGRLMARSSPSAGSVAVDEPSGDPAQDTAETLPLLDFGSDSDSDSDPARRG